MQIHVGMYLAGLSQGGRHLIPQLSASFCLTAGSMEKQFCLFANNTF